MDTPQVLEIWTDPEPETTLTYADEPVIFKPCCEWRMSRTKWVVEFMDMITIVPRRVLSKFLEKILKILNSVNLAS